MVTADGISQIDLWGYDSCGWHRSFTQMSLGKAFDGTFPGGEIELGARGNVLAAAAT